MDEIQELIKAVENSNTKDWFDYIVAISSLMVSVVAVTIGIRINQKFSLKNHMLQRQLETVYKLMETLQNQRFTIVVREKEDWAGLLCETSFFRVINLTENDKTLYEALRFEEPFYFTTDGNDSLEFIEFANNPYTPSSISKVINEFKWQGQKDWDNKELEREDRKVKTFLMESHKTNNHKLEKPTPWYIKEKRVHRNFKSFVEVSKELDLAIRKWLKKYEVDDLNY
jgi:hypothetical protein